MSLQVDRSGYRDVFKSTAIFGGTQIVTILVKVLLSKIIAVWVGVYGMGILGLYNTAIGLISNITNLGLQSSAVRDIASVSDDIGELSKRIKALERWVFFSGCIGSLLVIIFSPLLSEFYFKTLDYWIPFSILSFVILFNGMTQQKNAILQGTRKIWLLVRATIVSSLLTLVISVPIYYFLSERGIVWALLLSSIVTFLINLYYTRRVELCKVVQSYRESFFLGLGAVKLGLAMSLSLILGFLTEFIVRGYIARTGGVEDVGLYTAACAVNTQYLGLVFTAMAKDYYPRLSQNYSNNILMSNLMNKQAEIALLILGPLISIMIVGVDFFISLLYSSAFLSIVPMVNFLLLGSFVKAGSWGISFIFLAKNDYKMFVIIELVANLTLLPLYMIGYSKYDLVGIGYGFLSQYILYFILLVVIAWYKFRIYYTQVFFRLFVLIFLLLVALLIFSGFTIIKISLAILICVGCLFELNKRITLF